MLLETEQASDIVERRLWVLSYSLLLAPVFLLSVIGIVFFDSPSTSGTRWLFSGDELVAASIGIVGVVIFGIGCTEALRHFRFSRIRDWSSDVCSSDLERDHGADVRARERHHHPGHRRRGDAPVLGSLDRKSVV